jgi:hypothetical protein
LKVGVSQITRNQLRLVSLKTNKYAMKKILIILIIILISSPAKAQFIKNKSINGQVGYGISWPLDSYDDIVDVGFFLQCEPILTVASWLQLRPYAGFILTSSSGKDVNDNPTDEKGESKAFLIGGKARFRASSRWVAPFFELGFGSSIGKFETVTAYTNISKSGMICHIPFSFGLEMGRNHNIDLSFSYFLQPTVDQFAGAISVGISVPIKTNKE